VASYHTYLRGEDIPYIPAWRPIIHTCVANIYHTYLRGEDIPYIPAWRPIIHTCVASFNLLRKLSTTVSEWSWLCLLVSLPFADRRCRSTSEVLSSWMSCLMMYVSSLTCVRKQTQQVLFNTSGYSNLLALISHWRVLATGLANRGEPNHF